jgi:ribonuclease HI
LIYRQRAGPNRIFYIGIIRALEELFEAGWLNYSLKVQGDCKAVINQLNEIKWHPVDMKDLYDQVRSLEDKLKSVRRAQIEYEYLDESDSVYQKIDQCAKRGRAFIRERLF